MNGEKVRAILDLYDSMKQIIAERTRSQFSLATLDALFRHPIFESTDFVDRSGIPKPTAARVLRVLRDEKIISTLQAGKGQRPGMYLFDALIGIVKD